MKDIFGVLLMAIALWGGSYLVGSVIPATHWAMFPTAVTSSATFIAGYVLWAMPPRN